MEIDNRQLVTALKTAIGKLIEFDICLLQKEVNERSITHCLAAHLQFELPGLNVDVEYNDNLGNPKKLLGLADRTKVPIGHDEEEEQVVNLSDDQARTIYPDVIVHVRGKPLNFLVIEAKKASNHRRYLDIQKLKACTDPKWVTLDGELPLGYQLGVFLIFPVGEGKKSYQPQIQWFMRGEPVSEDEVLR